MSKFKGTNLYIHTYIYILNKCIGTYRNTITYIHMYVQLCVRSYQPLEHLRGLYGYMEPLQKHCVHQKPEGLDDGPELEYVTFPGRAYTDIRMCIHEYVHTYIYIYVYVYMYMYMFICICMYKCESGGSALLRHTHTPSFVTLFKLPCEPEGLYPLNLGSGYGSSATHVITATAVGIRNQHIRIPSWHQFPFFQANVAKLSHCVGSFDIYPTQQHENALVMEQSQLCCSPWACAWLDKTFLSGARKDKVSQGSFPKPKITFIASWACAFSRQCARSGADFFLMYPCWVFLEGYPMLDLLVSPPSSRQNIMLDNRS